MSVIDAAKRLHHAYEWRVWRARLPGYTRRTWEQLDHVCRQEFIDIAQAVHDGHTTFNDAPITEWVRHHAKEPT
ncbi:hypothetical protein [Corynebacterium freneyi]|uniref:Uncharacterized protein n=1 Tax=Corynebacterium freneyi TaxID=134034 RepID=A0ABS4U9Z0_9CORY|nr:hypothetical protein [Corynebacterium freneyi]MBP2333333.1 hypothetical protein [Corynebacterium freneyi]QXA52614.1 hypothetical protein I6L56_11310 [Corynebacterium freneyi]WJZ04563.1 hypothetical protein CFREN_02885 [Corynebacterium freneyi]